MSRAGSLGVLLVALASVSADGQRLLKAAKEAVKDEGGFRFRLSEGVDEGAPRARATPAAGLPVDDAATQRVLDRLPAWSAPEDERPFALRESSLPAPRPGRTVKEPFPPSSEIGRPEAPERGEPGPLRVLRRSPGGDTPLAPSLSVTFSQPMVAVTAHEDLEQRGAPGAAPARAAGPVALGRDEDSALRARGPIPDGHRLPRRGPRGDALGRGGSARRHRGLDLHDPCAHGDRRVSEGRAGPARAPALRRLRPADRPAGRGQGPSPAGGCDVVPGAPRDRRGSGGRPGREVHGRGGRKRPLAGLPADRAAARRRRGHGDGPGRHTLGRGPEDHAHRTGLELPHLRSVAGERAPLRLERPMPAPLALADRSFESDRREGLPQGHGARPAGVAGPQGRVLRPEPHDQRRIPRSHHVRGHARGGPDRRLRPDSRGTGHGLVHGRCRPREIFAPGVPSWSSTPPPARDSRSTP